MIERGGATARARRSDATPERAVLLIEDDPGVAEVLERSLDAEGLSTEVTTSGIRGAELAAVGDFSLVVLDLLLPDLDGLTVLTQIVERRPAQRVLVVSSLASSEMKVRCLDAGASDYLAKPFALNEFAARVRMHVRSSRELARASTSGAATLDFVTREVVVEGSVARLSQREFMLLDYLIRREGEVCSRTDILDSVWNIRFDPGTNVVDVYIRRLRRKIGDLRIETVRNAGYRFLAA